MDAVDYYYVNESLIGFFFVIRIFFRNLTPNSTARCQTPNRPMIEATRTFCIVARVLGNTSADVTWRSFSNTLPTHITPSRTVTHYVSIQLMAVRTPGGVGFFQMFLQSFSLSFPRTGKKLEMAFYLTFGTPTFVTFTMLVRLSTLLAFHIQIVGESLHGWVLDVLHLLLATLRTARCRHFGETPSTKQSTTTRRRSTAANNAVTDEALEISIFGHVS